MGFALWIQNDVLCAQGTHEYRPMGVAIVGRGSVFTARDFRPIRGTVHRERATFAGFFASLGEMNDYLKNTSPGDTRSQRFRKNSRKRSSRYLPYY